MINYNELTYKTMDPVSIYVPRLPIDSGISPWSSFSFNNLEISDNEIQERLKLTYKLMEPVVIYDPISLIVDGIVPFKWLSSNAL